MRIKRLRSSLSTSSAVISSNASFVAEIRAIEHGRRKFYEGQIDAYHAGGRGLKSVAAMGLVQHVDQVGIVKRKFTISEISEEFLEI